MTIVTRPQVQATLARAVANIHAAWEDVNGPLLICGTNMAPVDYGRQEDVWLEAEVSMMDSHQMDLAKDPKLLAYGQLELKCYTRKGQGSLKAHEIVEFFFRAVRREPVLPVRLHMPRFHKEYEHRGWYVLPVMVPFWYETV